MANGLDKADSSPKVPVKRIPVTPPALYPTLPQGGKTSGHFESRPYNDQSHWPHPVHLGSAEAGSAAWDRSDRLWKSQRGRIPKPSPNRFTDHGIQIDPAWFAVLGDKVAGRMETMITSREGIGFPGVRFPQTAGNAANSRIRCNSGAGRGATEFGWSSSLGRSPGALEEVCQMGVWYRPGGSTIGIVRLERIETVGIRLSRMLNIPIDDSVIVVKGRWLWRRLARVLLPSR